MEKVCKPSLATLMQKMLRSPLVKLTRIESKCAHLSFTNCNASTIDGMRHRLILCRLLLLHFWLCVCVCAAQYIESPRSCYTFGILVVPYVCWRHQRLRNLQKHEEWACDIVMCNRCVMFCVELVHSCAPRGRKERRWKRSRFILRDYLCIVF